MNMSLVNMTDDCPIYKAKSLNAGDINDLVLALQDPYRLEILRDLATKGLMLENIDFICEVFHYKTRAEAMMMNCTSVASDEMKAEGLLLYGQYLQINSPDEVNVSATTRAVLENQFKLWPPESNMVHMYMCMYIYKHEIYIYIHIFIYIY
jgi:hypothetical protein